MAQKTIFEVNVSELDNIQKAIQGIDSKRFISASPKISIKEALFLMAKNNILCLPIQSHNNPSIVVNLVNLFDILSYITHDLPVNSTILNPTLETIQDTKPRRRSLDSSHFLHPECYRRLTDPIESVMTLDSERESYRLYTCSLLDNIVGVISNFSKGLHRAVVTDKDGTPFLVLTQMDILRHIVKNPESLPKELYDKRISSLGLSLNKIIFVKEKELAINAYRLMAENRFTSIVVIDSLTDKILSNLSASSLRGLASNNLDHLILTVQDFMKASPRGQRPLVYCSAEITFWELIELLVSKNVHHAWLVDENEKPYASISPTDILRILKSYNTNH